MFDPIKFIKETQIELKKVTWPTRQRAVKLTQVVIIVSLIVSFYLGILDIMFGRLIGLLVK
ncbi:preprotein translocase subunit SecE [candidate division WWE3 bacterium RIFCSPLOWO2_01_FULL_39_13]|uniref:Protein translocase subunit SecE n=1 Tax=candidate division WWE3 bacterium RIFCSPLOWO2_01_FULL_39_13 TaxID=1802624 RepID=A0A1F4V481_UNCKA|nr:MAG: preprotein translocase subunit SecE [candidate division WWE3 bacterium RIFCSPLOWO2_01_FULL_39_13]